MAASQGRLNWRFYLLTSVLFISTLVVVSRLVQLQILQHNVYVSEARNEHLEQQALQGRRGAILDRNGHPLASSVDAWDVYVDRKAWHDPAVAREGAQVLAPLIGAQAEELRQAVAQAEPAEVLVARELDYATGRHIAQQRLPGVRLVASSRRIYPEGSLAAPLIGFIGRDRVGLTGLEFDYEDVLAGIPGLVLYERDSLGNRIPLGRSWSKAPRSGADIILTIDRYIQRATEQELDAAVQENRAKGGTIIVMDPRTGAILAMASRPTFDLTNLDLSDPQQMDLFRNRAVTDLYEPGSVFKLITAAAALNEGLVSPDSTYMDTGVVMVGGWAIRNWDYSSNGVQTVTQIIGKSLNTGAVWLAQLLGPDRFYDYVHRFGFGQPTNIGLSGEAAGKVRSHHNIGWSTVDLATNSFGQGIGVTPLQMITAVAAIANGGSLMRPYVVQGIATAEGFRPTEPQVVRQVITAETAKALTQMMVKAVDGVAWHPARLKDYRVAGKTGTAFVPVGGTYTPNRAIASFVGFAPAADPQIIILVKIDEPEGDALGAITAGPVFRRLAQRVLHYLKVPPDKPLVWGSP